MEADPYPSGYRFPVEAVVFALWVTAGLVGTFVVPGPDKALHRVLLWTTIACSYLLYVTFIGAENWLMVYLSQKYCILLPVDSRYQSAHYEVRKFNAERWNEW